MLVDFLANEAAFCEESYRWYAWDLTLSRKFHEDCQIQAAKDMEKFHTIKNE